MILEQFIQRRMVLEVLEESHKPLGFQKDKGENQYNKAKAKDVLKAKGATTNLFHSYSRTMCTRLNLLTSSNYEADTSYSGDSSSLLPKSRV